MEFEAEQEHENRGREGDEHGAEDHAGSQARTEGAAALVGIYFEDVPEEEDQERHEEQKDEDGEAGEGQRFAGGFRS